MFEYFQTISAEPWKPISRAALVAWIAFYAGFLAYAFSQDGGFLFIDSANLIVHEGGHNLFGWFGPTLGLWGGTLLQFENWLYTATYMADARVQELPLVTTGDPDFVEHDFHAIFSNMGVLDYDTKIAAVVRLLGWIGMLACVGWLAWRLRSVQPFETSR